MTREFLEAFEVNGAKLSKEDIDSILNENGKDIAAGKQALDTVKLERDNLKTQIKQRDADIKDLQGKVGGNEELTNQLTTLQTKYNNDTAALQKQIDDQKNDHATEKFFSSYEFSSEFAKKAVMAEFKAKGFKLDEVTGEYQGGKDWITELQKNSPDAFKAKEPEHKDPENGNLPYFVSSTTSGDKGTGGDNPFNFGFSTLRPVPDSK